MTITSGLVQGAMDLLDGDVKANYLMVTYTPEADWSGTDSFSYSIMKPVYPGGNTAEATVTFTVSPVNDPPVVTVGAAQQVIPGDLVTLSGSATDVDSTTLTYAWSQNSGTTVALTGADTATATFTAPEVNEVLEFKLAVSDGGSSITGLLTVTVAIPPAVWEDLFSGPSHIMATKTGETLWAWGGNDFGQLGLGDNTYQGSPVNLSPNSTWVRAALGGFHSLAVRGDGTLWAWGYNLFGQLGVAAGDRNNRLTPTQVGSNNNWVSVWAGDNESFGIQNDGSLWGWGNNNFGQLGLDNTAFQTQPQLVSAGPWAKVHVTSAQSNWGYTLGLKTDGTLWAWGRNNAGQLGLGETTDRHIPTQVDTSGFSGSVVGIGGSNPGNSFSSMFSLILLDDGTLWQTSSTTNLFSIEVAP